MAYRVRVDAEVRGLSRLRRLPREVRDRAIPLALDAAGVEIQRGVKRRTPVITGRLRNSWDTRRVSDRVLAVVNEVEYAAHVEYGTRPHEIRPRTRQALRFTPKGAERPVFARRVQHPGTRGRRMAQITAKEDAPAAARVAARAIEAYLAQWGYKL